MKLGPVRSKPLSERESYSADRDHEDWPLQSTLNIQSHEEFQPLGVNHSRVGDVSGSKIMPFVFQTNSPLFGISGVPVVFGTEAEPFLY